MKTLAVHRDDCVTCLLFKQMYIADTVVDRDSSFFFVKSSLKILFIAIMKKMMPLEGGGAVLGIYVETVLYRKHSNS